MQITTLAAGVSATDLQIEANLQKLGFKLTYNAPITDAILATVKVSLSRVHAYGGQTVIFYPMPLQHLLEISSHKEGAYMASAVNGTIVTGTIDVSNYGTLKMDGDYLSLTIENVANMSMIVYAIEGESFTDSSVEISTVLCMDSTTKLINVADQYALALPKASFSKLVLRFVDGRTATYNSDELNMIMSDINDLVAVFGNGTALVPTYGSSNLFVLSIGEVYECEVTYTGANGKIYLLTDK